MSGELEQEARSVHDENDMRDLLIKMAAKLDELDNLEDELDKLKNKINSLEDDQLD